MTAPVLLARLRERGVKLRVNGTRLAYEAPRGVLTAEDLASLRDRRDELIALLGPPTATPPDWETLSAMRWGEDDSPGIVIPAPDRAPAPPPDAIEPPGPRAARPRSWSALDCPAWADDDTLSVRSIDVRLASNEQADVSRPSRTKSSR